MWTRNSSIRNSDPRAWGEESGSGGRGGSEEVPGIPMCGRGSRRAAGVSMARSRPGIRKSPRINLGPAKRETCIWGLEETLERP